MRMPIALIACLALPFLVACSKGPDAPVPAQESPAAPQLAGITPNDRVEAKEIFATRCTPCHGPTGAGDGVASAGLTPKPRNLTEKTWQAGVTDEHIEKIIQYGGAAVAKSPAMPPNPDLVAKPAVVSALREHVRGLSL